MTLFVNGEYVINRNSTQNGKTDIEVITDSGYEKTGEADIRFEDNRLMIKISRADVDFGDSFSFKWADNYTDNDVCSFYTKGDSAPYGRLCYRY